MSFETYWLIVPVIGAVIAWAGCLGLWLTGRHAKHQKAAAE